MAFVNERIPKNERREFQVSKYQKITPFTWTIDRERNIFLFECGYHIETAETEFRFVWEGKVFKVVLKKDTFMPNIVKWSISDFIIPDEYKCKEEIILENLREAMKVYGFSGYEYNNSRTAEVVINF